MYLKSLEISGFKSFAKKGEFGFTTPITAIVGPNGSGKSNVAEAFRFVLGEQSIKTLRGKRGEDLIWNGSGMVPKANRASVKIFLDNTGRKLQSDFDEVTIERVVHRDGVNQYFINGTQVRLKDVVELLAGANIGQSGHHIISQGEADRILTAHPRERRIMLEEALGLKLYHYKKDESEKKLIKTEENIAHVEGLRKEIVPHLRFLKKQVEKVEKAEVMRGELLELYKEYLYHEELYITGTKAHLESELLHPKDELRQLEEDIDAAKKTMLRGGAGDAKSKEVVALEEAMSRIRGEKQQALREVGRLEGQIELAKKMALRGAAAAGDHTVSFHTLKKVYEEARGYLVKAGETEDLPTIKELLSKAEATLRTFIEAGEKPQSSESKRESADLDVLLETLKKTEVTLEVITKEETDMLRSYEALRKTLESEKDESRKAERKVFELMTKKNELGIRVTELRGKLDTLLLVEEEWKRELAEASVLVGRSVQDYREANRVLSEKDILGRDRAEQEEKKRTIERMKIRLEEYGAGATEEIMREYKEVSERDAFLEREITDLTASAGSLQSLIEDLEARLQLEFQEGLQKINTEFARFFELMFGGGHAELIALKEKKKKKAAPVDELLGDEESEGEVLEEEEIEEGIDIAVNLPKKRIKSLIMLSGGERALTSIALIFAMSQVNPPPFVILDETDAALDEANSKRYGDMVENLSKKSQLIVITHNRETMSRAGVLYGVTMGGDGVSKLLSVKFEEAVAVAK